MRWGGVGWRVRVRNGRGGGLMRVIGSTMVELPLRKLGRVMGG